MIGKLIVASVVLASLALVAVIQTTNPSSIGPVGLLAVFFLLYVIVFGCFVEILYTASRGIAWLSRRFMTSRPPAVLSLKRSIYFSSVVALGPIMLLAMKSIGSLGPYEIGLVGFFLLIGILYVSKRAPR